MPKKVRELKAILLKAGFSYESAKGSHTKWSHPLIIGNHTFGKRWRRCQIISRTGYQRSITTDSGGTRMMIELKPRYTVIVQWSDDDDCCVVSLPEWGEFCHTHGETYEEAIVNAQEVLEMLIEGTIDRGEDLSIPQTFQPIVANAA